mmetsp:Transcript_17183/g.32383  ORF Transcript_17183/g.32383 Transcript_17183/m.32383 type:complete len:171 (+) Transcript_17183:35-547(+)
MPGLRRLSSSLLVLRSTMLAPRHSLLRCMPRMRQVSSMPPGAPKTERTAAEEEEQNLDNCPMFAGQGGRGRDAGNAPPDSRLLGLFRLVPKDAIQSIHAAYWLFVGGPVPRHLAAKGVVNTFSMELIMIRLAARVVAFGIGSFILFLTSRKCWRKFRGTDTLPEPAAKEG